MAPILSINNLSKTYASGFKALDHINLDINAGEVFALLGPNGAGKTTLIGTSCGIVSPSEGEILIGGFDTNKEYKKARRLVGLVPQELSINGFETVWETVSFTRGLFGKSPNPQYIEQVLRDLSLWEKQDQKVIALSGGMKRRVLIAKALSHEPQVLFLDEPSAGVDVELRQSMWKYVHKLKEAGVTIVLTTHYLEEAEEMADRIGVINKGRLVLVEDKKTLMLKMGKKQLKFCLKSPITSIPKPLEKFNLKIVEDGRQLLFSYDTKKGETGISALFEEMGKSDVKFNDIQTSQSSLEEIFVSLVQ